MMTETKLFDHLKELKIEYTLYTHEPVYTVEQAQKTTHVPGVGVKNLFLKDDKKRLYLVVAQFDTMIALKKLAKKLYAPKLRFAQADLLKKYLGVEPGSVTPLGLINDTNHEIMVIFDAALLDNDLIGVHPLRNNATVTLTPHDLKLFVEHIGNAMQVIDFVQL